MITGICELLLIFIKIKSLKISVLFRTIKKQVKINISIIAQKIEIIRILLKYIYAPKEGQ
ncbi:hypothetical protein UA69_21335 [Photobacterium angustum]|nr:hypothetical protein UA69_21335 [Photobacterium angustum]